MAFNIGFYAYAIIGHTGADQLLPQLLMEQFDTLPSDCPVLHAIFIPPQTLFVVGYSVFTLSVRPCVRPCVCPSVRNVLFF